MALRDLLWHHYRFDETVVTSGKAVADVWGNTNLLITGGDLSSTIGKLGNALTLQSSRYCLANSSSDWDHADGNLSGCCWIKLAGTGSSHPVCSKYNSPSNREWLVYFDSSSGQFQLIVSADGSAVTTLSASAFGTVASETWYFLAWYHDADNDEIGVAVNGVWNTQSYSSGLFRGTAIPQAGTAGTSPGASIDSLSLWGRIVTGPEFSQIRNHDDGLPWYDWDQTVPASDTLESGLVMQVRKLFVAGGYLSYGCTLRSEASFKPQFEGTNQGTLSFWLETSPDTVTVVMNAPAASGTYYVYRYPETSIHKWRVRWPTIGTNIDEYTDNDTGGPAGTVMFTIVRNGDTLITYMNGELLQTFTGLPTDDNDAAGTGNVDFGATAARAYAVNAWNRALTVYEIQDLYVAGADGWPGAAASGGGSAFSGFGGGGA